MYFLITDRGDGVCIDPLGKEELLEAINPDEEGETSYGKWTPKFLKEIPLGGFNIDEAIIVCGEIVLPVVVSATKLKVP